MWLPRTHADKGEETHGFVAVAIDKDKGSQHALKWAADHLVSKGQTMFLIHVKHKVQTVPTPMGNHVSITEIKDEVASTYREQQEAHSKDLFLPFRCFCSRKDIHTVDIILEDVDVAKGIIEYVTHSSIENLVMGTSSRNGFMKRFKSTDIPTNVTKGAPDFCTVYVINKGKISSVRSASRPAPVTAPHWMPGPIQARQEPKEIHISKGDYDSRQSHSSHSEDDLDPIKSPFSRGSRPPLLDTDISFVSSGKPSTEQIYPSLYDHLESGRRTDYGRPPRLSNHDDDTSSTYSGFESPLRSSVNRPLDMNSSMIEFSSVSQDCGRKSWSSNAVEDVETEMRRLKLELKQTMDMYSTACKEALTAKQKAKELHRWKIEEEHRLEEARYAEEAALVLVEKEKAKCRAAMEAAEASHRIAELEAQKRMNAEMRALKEGEEKKKALNALANSDARYRKYTIEEIEIATDYFSEARKIGEGGYGPVYKCYMDHTSVAVKVLRPESAAQGRTQFQQEIEVLSCIRHPNMVLLVGACPEYGCLVYEYMANGSLDDCLFRRANTPPLSWQLRFRIAAEIGTALLFLHQTKPEPLVHRDLKPGNILLDRNYVSKISDVGLARLVPPNVANDVTQYRMTSTAGTFCYIDPEYQQTGMLGIKSDIYSLGILLLQLITAKPPMGLTHHVERSIEKGKFAEMLDPQVLDWPIEEALKFAQLSLKCAELRRKDRPDLGTVVLPALERLRELAEGHMDHIQFP